VIIGSFVGRGTKYESTEIAYQPPHNMNMRMTGTKSIQYRRFLIEGCSAIHASIPIRGKHLSAPVQDFDGTVRRILSAIGFCRWMRRW
jgi:hypothetical protein